MARLIDYVANDPSAKTVIVNAFWAGRGVNQDGLAATLKHLKSAGKKVFVLDDVPDFPFDAFGCKYRKAPLLPYTECSASSAGFLERYSSYLPELENAVRQAPGVTLLKTARYFCSDSTCNMTFGDKLLYADSSHLNGNGSRYLARRMLDDSPSLAAAVDLPAQ
jgi:hypothetical protein